ncbi:glycoside hydrolase family 9 protein, partial [bacterium]|nr:glycoside hydrolase family 9 protein [bacterium]
MAFPDLKKRKQRKSAALSAAIILLISAAGCTGSASGRTTGLVGINLNQVGYRTNAVKRAFVTGYEGAWRIVGSNGKTVLSGETAPAGFDPLAGDEIARIDFDGLTRPGEYRIVLSAAGIESYPFTVDDDPYGALADALLKNFYFQRCGTALTEEYAGMYAHSACHTRPAVLYGTDTQIDVTGGWHDAGDYGRYSEPGACAAAMLLLAYDSFPGLFGDDLGIPESGNGVPDILDEVRWELDWLMKMQDPATGGVFHKAASVRFPGFVMPEKDYSTIAVHAVSPTATAATAAVLAQAARIWRGIDVEYASVLLEAAEFAYGWIIANTGAPGFKNPPGVESGEYGDASAADESFWAAMELYRTTGRETCRDQGTVFRSEIRS